MALSPNYGWAEPDNSSLVKNGAQDIRALGDAIDTSVWNVGYGQAGKNKIINGDFGIWQRGTSFTAGYSADRFSSRGDVSTFTVTRETFTPGSAPISGYESNFFMRNAVTSGGTAASRYLFEQRIEDVRTFAGQTVTFSFWAKANAAKTIAIEIIQNFGSGGSANVSTVNPKQSITTAWVRYTTTVAIPVITGKTIGSSSYISLAIWLDAGSDFNSRTNSLGNQSGTFDFWGVQAEYGSTATPFQTASGGSPQAELAMCQRYYNRSTQYQNIGYAASTTIADSVFNFPTMRIAPTLADISGYSVTPVIIGTTYSGGTTTLITSWPSTVKVRYTHGSAVFTLGATCDIGATYLGLSAEL